jgi:hypothetical protein
MTSDAERRQHLRNAGIQAVLEHSNLLESTSVGRDCSLDPLGI